MKLSKMNLGHLSMLSSMLGLFTALAACQNEATVATTAAITASTGKTISESNGISAGNKVSGGEVADQENPATLASVSATAAAPLFEVTSLESIHQFAVAVNDSGNPTQAAATHHQFEVTLTGKNGDVVKTVTFLVGPELKYYSEPGVGTPRKAECLAMAFAVLSASSEGVTDLHFVWDGVRDSKTGISTLSYCEMWRGNQDNLGAEVYRPIQNGQIIARTLVVPTLKRIRIGRLEGDSGDSNRVRINGSLVLYPETDRYDLIRDCLGLSYRRLLRQDKATRGLMIKGADGMAGFDKNSPGPGFGKSLISCSNEVNSSTQGTCPATFEMYPSRMLRAGA